MSSEDGDSAQAVLSRNRIWLICESRATAPSMEHNKVLPQPVSGFLGSLEMATCFCPRTVCHLHVWLAHEPPSQVPPDSHSSPPLGRDILCSCTTSSHHTPCDHHATAQSGFWNGFVCIMYGTMSEKSSIMFDTPAGHPHTGCSETDPVCHRFVRLCQADLGP